MTTKPVFNPESNSPMHLLGGKDADGVSSMLKLEFCCHLLGLVLAGAGDPM